MQKSILTLILALSCSISNATQKNFIAKVVFQNLTNKEFTSGVLTIISTNQKIEINKTKGCNIVLPKKGKYQFTFKCKDFTTRIYFPKRINKRKNTITILLMDINMLEKGSNYEFTMNLDTKFTIAQIEKRISDGTLYFIILGIDGSIPNEYLKFKEKYSIGLVKWNCAIDPLSFKKARENNLMISDYLDHKYGTEWLAELKIKPFGLKQKTL